MLYFKYFFKKGQIMYLCYQLVDSESIIILNVNGTRGMAQQLTAPVDLADDPHSGSRSNAAVHSCL